MNNNFNLTCTEHKTMNYEFICLKEDCKFKRFFCWDCCREEHADHLIYTFNFEDYKQLKNNTQQHGDEFHILFNLLNDILDQQLQIDNKNENQQINNQNQTLLNEAIPLIAQLFNLESEIFKHNEFVKTAQQTIKEQTLNLKQQKFVPQVFNTNGTSVSNSSLMNTQFYNQDYLQEIQNQPIYEEIMMNQSKI